MSKVFAWALLPLLSLFWVAVPAQESPEADKPPPDPRVEEFARELEQRSGAIAEELKDLAEFLKRDAEVIDNFAEEWARQLGDELMRKSEELIERSLEQIPRRQPPPPAAPPTKQIEI